MPLHLTSSHIPSIRCCNAKLTLLSNSCHIMLTGPILHTNCPNYTMNQVRDLLSPNAKLKLQDLAGVVTVHGLKSTAVGSAGEVSSCPRSDLTENHIFWAYSSFTQVTESRDIPTPSPPPRWHTLPPHPPP